MTTFELYDTLGTEGGLEKLDKKDIATALFNLTESLAHHAAERSSISPAAAMVVRHLVIAPMYEAMKLELSSVSPELTVGTPEFYKAAKEARERRAAPESK